MDENNELVASETDAYAIADFINVSMYLFSLAENRADFCAFLNDVIIIVLDSNLFLNVVLNNFFAYLTACSHWDCDYRIQSS